MASLVKPIIIRYLDATGRQVPKGTPGARPVKERAKKWYAQGVPGWPRHKREPLATHKMTAQALLNRLVEDALRGQAGLTDKYAKHRAAPVADHLAAYRKHLEAKGDTPKHVELVTARVREVCDGCGFKFLGDVEAGRVLDWLADRRLDRPPPRVPPDRATFTKAEVAAVLGVTPDAVRQAVLRHRLPATGNGKARRYPRETVERLCELAGRGLSVQTANHYIAALKGFCRWLVRDRRLGENPVEHVQGGNPATDRRHDRRELPVEELVRVLEAARASPRAFRGLTGPDRYNLYLCACGSGFRADELAALRPESFALTAAPPTVTLGAGRAKNRKAVRHPLPPGVAAALSDYLAGKPGGQAVWPGTWVADAAEMLRIDLAAAGVPYTVEGPDGPLYADFHALRHSYISGLSRAGLTVKQLQVLARHSTPELTIGRYSHASLPELGAAAGKLPALVAAPAAVGAVIDAVSVPVAEYQALTTWAAVGLALLAGGSVAPPVAQRGGPDRDGRGRPGTPEAESAASRPVVIHLNNRGLGRTGTA
jgi:excisionase family DNA binding protein